MNRRSLLLTLPALLAARPIYAQELRALFDQGGVALLLRHAQTDPGIGDPPNFRVDDCRTQRNLSDAGRAQAQRFGAAIKAQALRIDEVHSSRWCRCLDTARLAFPAHKVQPMDALNSFFRDRDDEPAQTAAVRRYLAGLGKRNAALVTHQVNISALAGEATSMGEALVVRSNGDRMQVVGRIPPP